MLAVSGIIAAAPAGASPPDKRSPIPAGLPVAVDVMGASEPVLCAEKDNVTVNFTAPGVRAFRIEAAHPAYIGSLVADSFAADWAACDMTGDPAHAGAVTAPTRRTIYEEPEIWLVGWTFPTFWRPATATVRIGDRVERGLHLVQVWMIRPMGGEEILVFYPQDGYWRARPLAPAGKAPTAFGSSFLLGPVEVDRRPIVRLDEIAFDPKARSFTLKFARGGSATLSLAAIDQNRTILDIAFDRAIEGVPFAALRSMYVTETNNDVARIGIRAKGAKGWSEEPIMSFKRAAATSVWAGRVAPSRHNTSSPDMIFDSFRGAPR
ncbi:MAG TPA: hypothetical protein PK264_04220 [Hyphomicrobiaceae bacterium]|nr:hypothetical protein [Hyphomicrobiaceae bacterium]